MRPASRYKGINAHMVQTDGGDHTSSQLWVDRGTMGLWRSASAGRRGMAMDRLPTAIVCVPSSHCLRSGRTRGIGNAGTMESSRYDPRRVPGCRLSAFSLYVTALCGRIFYFSPLLISHRVPCGLSHRTLGAARRHHWNHSFSPASWQSRGRDPNAEQRIGEPTQGVLGLGSQFSP